MQVQCYEGEHWFWAAAVGVPGLVMALGFPVSVWLSLRAYRDDFWVCEISATRKFAFLFADYKPMYVCILLFSLMFGSAASPPLSID